MKLMDEQCGVFAELLSSKSAVPGGGGASAYVGALGIALGNMVGNLTLGKKKYQDVEEEILKWNEQASVLRKRLVDLVEEDAVAFAPLAKAYGLPQNTEEEKEAKRVIIERELKNACEVPMKIMECCCEAIELLENYEKHGTKIAISDAGVGAAFCRAALTGASLNVFINTKLMNDIERKESLNQKAQEMLDEYVGRADRLYQRVEDDLKGERKNG